MKKTFILLSILNSVAVAGTGQGGGTPPALQDKLEMLISKPQLDGGLFTAETGDIGLLSRKALQPQMLVSSRMDGGTPPAIRMMGGSSSGTPPALASGSVGGSNPPSLTISEDDIAVLRGRKKPIDAVGHAGQNLSFDIQAGDTLDSVVLKDRRFIMRESINANQ